MGHRGYSRHKNCIGNEEITVKKFLLISNVLLCTLSSVNCILHRVLSYLLQSCIYGFTNTH